LSEAVIARALGLLVITWALAASFWSFALASAPGSAPDYALDSLPLYRLERVALAVLLVTAPGAVVAQLLTGRVPRSIGRVGVEFSTTPDDALHPSGLEARPQLNAPRQAPKSMTGQA